MRGADYGRAIAKARYPDTAGSGAFRYACKPPAYVNKQAAALFATRTPDHVLGSRVGATPDLLGMRGIIRTLLLWHCRQ